MSKKTRKVKIDSPVRFNATITVSLPDDLKRSLTEKALRVNTTVSNVVRQILTKVKIDTADIQK